MATTYGNLNKVRKLTNSSLTSIIDVTNLNFATLSDAVKIFLQSIEYDETLNSIYVSTITADNLIATDTIAVKNNGITKLLLDNQGRLEGATMLFEVTETQRQRFVSYPDYPETGVDGEIIFTGLDLIAWFDERGWVSLTTGNEGGGGGIVTSITTTSPYVTITPPSGIGEVTIDVEGGFGTLIGGGDEIGRIPKWTDTLELHDSSILDDGDSVTIETDVYLPDIPNDGTNSITEFVVIGTASNGILKKTSQVVRTIDGNIVDNTDPNNPVIDQVQADWTQSDTGEVSYINNKPNVTQDGTTVVIGDTLYLDTISDDVANVSENTFLVILPSGEVQYTQEVVRAVSGNIVDNTDPNNPVIDQVQADWNQTDTNEVSYINNKPDILWISGDGYNSIIPEYVDEVAMPVALGTWSTSYGKSNIASTLSSKAEGYFSVTGEKLYYSKNEFSFPYSDSIRIKNVNKYEFYGNLLAQVITKVYLLIPQSTYTGDQYDQDYLNNSDTWESATITDSFIVGEDIIIILDVSGLSAQLSQTVQLIFRHVALANERPGISVHGTNTSAFGEGSHAEGGLTRATGKFSHASGYLTESDGPASFSLGNSTRAIGENSVSAGENTIAAKSNSKASGQKSFAGVSVWPEDVMYSIASDVFELPDDYTSYFNVGDPLPAYQAYSEPTSELPRVFTYGNIERVYSRYVANTVLLPGSDSLDDFATAVQGCVKLKNGLHFAVYGTSSTYGSTQHDGLIILDNNFNVVATPSIVTEDDNGNPINSYIYKVIECEDGSLIVVGTFTEINSIECRGVAKFDRSYYPVDSFNSAIGEGFTHSSNAYPVHGVPAIYDVAETKDDHIIISGYFDEYQGDLNIVKGFAKIDFNTGALNINFSVFAEPLSVENFSLLVGDDNTTYIAMNGPIYSNYAFTNTLITSNGICRLMDANGTSAITMGACNDVVKSICFNRTKTEVILGGIFTSISDTYSNTSSSSLVSVTADSLSLESNWQGFNNSGSWANNGVLSINLMENGEFMVGLGDSGTTEYQGIACNNTVIVTHYGALRTELCETGGTLLGSHLYPPYGMIELSTGDIICVGKINQVDLTVGYNNIFRISNDGSSIRTTVIADSEYPWINGKDYLVQIRHDTGELSSSFSHGENVAAVGRRSITLGSNSVALAEDSITLGTEAVGVSDKAITFSSRSIERAGDAQNVVFTGAYEGYIMNSSQKHELAQVYIHSDLNGSVTLEKIFSVFINVVGVVIQPGTSGLNIGDTISTLSQLIVRYDPIGDTIVTQDWKELYGLGEIFTTASTPGYVFVDNIAPGKFVFYYKNSGFTFGNGDGLIRFSATFNMTEVSVSSY